MRIWRSGMAMSEEERHAGCLLGLAIFALVALWLWTCEPKGQKESSE
jgi:hypothetical protein